MVVRRPVDFRLLRRVEGRVEGERGEDVLVLGVGELLGADVPAA